MFSACDLREGILAADVTRGLLATLNFISEPVRLYLQTFHASADLENCLETITRDRSATPMRG